MILFILTCFQAIGQEQIQVGDSVRINKKGNEITLCPNTEYAFNEDTAVFNEIINNIPEILSEYPIHPSTLNYCSVAYDTLRNESLHIDFTTVGINTYFSYYAHNLSLRNKSKPSYKIDRATLYESFQLLIDLYNYCRMTNGFAAISQRAPAIIEYYIFYKSDDSDVSAYKIDKQREYFLQYLQQFIYDETTNNYSFSDTKRKNAGVYIKEKIEKLDHLLTNKFYLSSVQKFEVEMLKQ